MKTSGSLAFPSPERLKCILTNMEHLDMLWDRLWYTVILDWPRTFCVDNIGLKLTEDLPACASRILGLKECAAILSSLCSNHILLSLS